jgi:hypothetical protein
MEDLGRDYLVLVNNHKHFFFFLISDVNKYLYLVFVGAVFSQHLGLFLEQLG